MNTNEVLSVIKEMVPENTAFIVSLGRTSEEAFQLFPNQSLFLDSMGDVASIACGVALGLGPPHPVVALDTDGSHLMGMSLLPTLATVTPRVSNLLIVVIDNGIYESGGGLPSREGDLNWLSLGKAFGLEIVTVDTEKELLESLKGVFSRFIYLVARVENVSPIPITTKNIDGVESKYRFSRHLEKMSGRILIKPAVKC